MPRFDHYIAVDWSAANGPTMGKDSIWVGVNGRAPLNLPTRYSAIDYLARAMHVALAQGERIILGFDFAFGYPRGTAERLGVDGWAGIWALIHDLVEDSPDNQNNRFEVGGALNRRLGFAVGPFWGHPASHHYEGLSPEKEKALFDQFPEWRMSDKQTKGAHSVWKLAYAGAVGSQTLLGIAALERLRRDPVLGPHIAIWPFETDFANDLSQPIIITEIFPTSHTNFPSQPYAIRDAQQVVQVAQDFAHWDKEGLLEGKLAASHLKGEERTAVLHEEGWIVGQ